jgi:hypothetical protein
VDEQLCHELQPAHIMNLCLGLFQQFCLGAKYEDDEYGTLYLTTIVNHDITLKKYDPHE